MLLTVALCVLAAASSHAADESCVTNSSDSCVKVCNKKKQLCSHPQPSTLLQKGFQTHTTSFDNDKGTIHQQVESSASPAIGAYFSYSLHFAEQPGLLMEKGLARAASAAKSPQGHWSHSHELLEKGSSVLAQTHKVESSHSHRQLDKESSVLAKSQPEVDLSTWGTHWSPSHGQLDKGSSALAQTHKVESSHSHDFRKLIKGSSALAKRQPEVDLFTWGTDAQHPETTQHPKTIGKHAPHPSVQNYEASLAYLTGMVLNIFVKASSGNGGLLLALEVPSACGSADAWVEVSRARCSVQYPCALRLPGLAVRGSAAQPTRFRTRVILEDDDYSTDFMEYERVTLDKEVEVVVAHEQSANDDPGRAVKFSLSPALASGALYVMPIVQNAGADTMITMRLRQPEPPEAALLDTSNSATHKLQATLQSYRKSWASDWRDPVGAINACDFSLFEVVADQLYPGEVELEVLMFNHTSGTNTTISDVLVTTRVSPAQAEVALLDTVLKDHFAYFNDPEVIIHGLPAGALKQDDHGEFWVSNPTEWGYAMQSWVIMAETGVLKPGEAVGKLKETFTTLNILQQDPNQFTHGMFYPLYRVRSVSGEKIFPQKAENADEIPCGDDALLYSSMLMVQGWLTANGYHSEANTCAEILARVDFSQCLHVTDCNEAVNGQTTKNEDPNLSGDKFWSIPLTWNANTLEKNTWNWNVWADEGGVVAMIIAMTGVVDNAQYEELVREQMRYSPCQSWEGISVGHGAFFNSVFTLPTRSMMGLGTLFSSPYLHEFAVRSVLPTFRAHQKLKKKIGVDYIGPSDAMTQALKSNGKVLGSYAYWPPNSHYDCRLQRTIKENQCTWCEGVQYGGEQDAFDMVVPHGNMASFLVAGMMETSQFTSWLEDTKLLMTDASGVYKHGYGLEVVAPAKRTPPGGSFGGAQRGRGIWESLSHAYIILGMYEGMATMRRRYEVAAQENGGFAGFYEPPSYKPLSDFVDFVPGKRDMIDNLLAVAHSQQSQEKQCNPSNYGPAGKY